MPVLVSVRAMLFDLLSQHSREQLYSTQQKLLTCHYHFTFIAALLLSIEKNGQSTVILINIGVTAFIVTLKLAANMGKNVATTGLAASC